MSHLRTSRRTRHIRIRGPELVSNGTFTTNTTSWSAANSATLAVSVGELQITSAGSFSFAYQSIPTTIGRVYSASAAGHIGTAVNVYFAVGTAAGGQQQGIRTNTLSAPSTMVISFVATTSAHFVNLLNGTELTGTGLYDNATMRCQYTR